MCILYIYIYIPSYLSSVLHPYTPSCALHSASAALLTPTCLEIITTGARALVLYLIIGNYYHFTLISLIR